MKCLLTCNLNSSNNLGTAAQIITFSRMLISLIPKVSLTLFSFYPNIDSHFYSRYGIHVLSHDIKSDHVLLSMIPLTPNLLKYSLKNFKLLNNAFLDGIFYDFADHDVVIDFSGDAITDVFDKGLMPTGLLVDMLPILLGMLGGKPVILYSQSIGPFKKVSYPLARFILNKTRLIVLREHLSYYYLKSMKLVAPLIFGSEIAFLLDSAPPSVKVLNKVFNEEGNLTVGFSVSAFQGSLFSHLRSLLAHVIRWLVQKMKAYIIFIPHVYSSRGDEDDRAEARRIMRLADVPRDYIVAIEEKLTPEEVKWIIGKCDLFIGGRFHATIASLSQCIPTIMIGHSHKYYATMKRLQLTEYCCALPTTTVDELKAKIQKALIEGEKLRALINYQVRIERDYAMRALEFTANILKNL